MKKSNTILSTAEKKALKIKKFNRILFVLLLLSVVLNYLLIKGIIQI